MAYLPDEGHACVCRECDLLLVRIGHKGLLLDGKDALLLRRRRVDSAVHLEGLELGLEAHGCIYVCVCVCVCVYIYIMLCMYVCVRMYVVCVRIDVCMYACMHVCMYACMHVCMYACIYVCMCMHACIRTHTHTHNTHTHTQLHMEHLEAHGLLHAVGLEEVTILGPEVCVSVKRGLVYLQKRPIT